MMLCPDRAALGWGAHGADAEYLLVKAQNCLKLPEELSFIDGAMIACQAGTAYSALKKMKVGASDHLAVFGLGPVGLVSYMLAAAMGARVIGIEKDSRRIELAAKIGMSDIVDINSVDCVETLREMTAGEGPNKIIETSGSVDAQRDGAEAAAIRGQIVLVGVSGPFYASIETRIRPRSVITKELQIMGSYIFTISDYFPLAELMRTRRIDFERIITHRFPLSSAEEALELFDQGGTGKIIFEFD
jgi:propanol-preferring alcohol dehydrogenase